MDCRDSQVHQVGRGCQEYLDGRAMTVDQVNVDYLEIQVRKAIQVQEVHPVTGV